MSGFIWCGFSVVNENNTDTCIPFIETRYSYFKTAGSYTGLVACRPE